jgi:hypothetical protein
MKNFFVNLILLTAIAVALAIIEITLIERLHP